MKITKKSAEKRLLKTISDYIRLRDNYTCYTCGKIDSNPRKMNAGHLFSRRHKAIKYDERNIHCQCVYCNKYLAGNLHEYIRRFKSEFGDEEYERLYKIKDDKTDCTIDDFIRLTNYYKDKIDQQRSNKHHGK